MRIGALVLLIFVLSGCGNKRPQWPATIVGYQGFTSAQQDQVSTALGSLDSQMVQSRTMSQTTAFMSLGPIYSSPTSAPASAYPIQIEYVDADDWQGEQAGLAIVSSDQCIIQLSSRLFDDPQYQNYLVPVVYHEAGHCAGLYHVTTAGEIMYPSTNSASNYSTDQFQRFFKSFVEAAGL